MRLYEIELTFHDHLYYETRTLGRLYETGRLLHNIALSYALGLAQTTYHHARDIPAYATEMADLNETGIYVTPAADLDIQYVVHTFKYGDERNSMRMTRSNKNLPTYGRAKEIATGSRFRFGVLTEAPMTFPTWIRMGIWMSKAHLEVTEIALTPYEAATQVVSRYPLNPRDLPETAMMQVFDLVSMRPSSLVENALIKADAWWRGTHPEEHDADIWLPADMMYNL